MAGPTLRVRKLRPGVQRGSTPSHSGCAPRSRRLGEPAHHPLTLSPASPGSGFPAEGPGAALDPLAGGFAFPSSMAGGWRGKSVPLRTGPALPYPWPLLGPWPGGCREALPCRDRQENAELSLVQREEGLVCEVACSGDRTQHTPCQPERRGEAAREQGRDRKEKAPAAPGAQPTPAPTQSSAAASLAPRLSPTPAQGHSSLESACARSPRVPPWPPGPSQRLRCSRPRRHMGWRDPS